MNAKPAKQGIAIASIFAMTAIVAGFQPPQADAAIQCNVIGDNLLNCPAPGPLYAGPTIVVNYAPPFSDTDGGCGGEAIETNEAEGMFTFKVANSWGGCPHEVGDIVTYTTEPFFVTPESPVGAIAMVTASMAALGGFLYFRIARKPSSIA
jgi:hypothetical protein